MTDLDSLETQLRDVSQERATALAKVQDLAMLVRRLLSCEKSSNRGAMAVADQAWDYLKRNGLEGSPARLEALEKK